MKIIEVRNSSQIRDFLNIPLKIYKDNPNWIQPLDKDIEAVFDPQKNKLFQRGGQCVRWILQNNKGESIGRVATFINPKYKEAQPTGGIGFFEVIEDREAAFYLFNHCKNWLQERGMEAMDGPINFGERDRWWGLLIKGYHEPLYGMNYNPPYYVNFFEEYGFQIYFKQLCFGMPVERNFQPKFFERHKEISNLSNIHVENVQKKNLIKYAKDFTTVYNAAWAQHGGGKTMDERLAIKIFKTMKPVLDEDISWFAYEDNDPVAMWINLPDLNFYFKRLHGKFGLWQKIKFLWYKKTIPNNRFTGIVFGVVPKWQGKGMDSYLIVESSGRFVDQCSYTDYEMQWIGDFNPKMVNIGYNLGATITRELATYRYLFDRNKEFKRHPTL